MSKNTNLYYKCAYYNLLNTLGGTAYPDDLALRIASRASFTFGALNRNSSVSFKRMELLPIACILSRSIRDDASRGSYINFRVVIAAVLDILVALIRG